MNNLLNILEGDESVYSCILYGDVLEEENMITGYMDDEEEICDE